MTWTVTFIDSNPGRNTSRLQSIRSHISTVALSDCIQSRRRATRYIHGTHDIQSLPPQQTTHATTKSIFEIAQRDHSTTVHVHAQGISFRRNPLYAESNRHSPLEPKVPTARPDRKRDLALRLGPSLAHDVPHAQIIPRQRNRHRLLLVLVQEDIGETFEDGRGFTRRDRMVEVQLGDLYEL